ncbi:methyltransferase [Photobacterium makurazakiensis]|uniref:class I SAM-dependent methyltransferase n=1 Tax=Photobacterium makurazakiensis TaxID=2910234 RepID=UPI003D11610D
MDMFRQFINNPKEIGSIAPSSSSLINKMTEDIKNYHSIVELGAGNGCITKKIIDKGCSSLHTYETNPFYINRINKINDINLKLNAFNLQEDVKKESVDIVISSLPFLNFNQKEREDLLEQISFVLKENGLLIMYSYSSKQSFTDVQLYFNNLRMVGYNKAWLNLPPAHIFKYKKHSHSKIENNLSLMANND